MCILPPNDSAPPKRAFVNGILKCGCITMNVKRVLYNYVGLSGLKPLLLPISCYRPGPAEVGDQQCIPDRQATG